MVRYLFCAGGNNSVVECDLAKVEVAGSNPVSRSNLRSRLPVRVSYGWQATAKVVRPKLAVRVKADHINDDDIRPIDALLPLAFRRGRITRREFQPAPSPSGKAEVCKTSIPGSNPGGASKFT